jgi:general nucleoside transport system ATP-binding protein
MNADPEYGKPAVGEPPKPLLQMRNITKRFPMVLANDCVDFELNEGEIHCLLGENGAGKSTLAECLYGFYKPDEGDIIVNGEKVQLSNPTDAIHHGIGMVHQHFSLVDVFTVLDNVILGAQETGFFLDTDKVEKRLMELCALYEVNLDIHAKVWQLSVGEQQWVEILKALYAGVKLLVLDEPTAVLTPLESERLFAVLQKMKAEGLAIIFITHKLEEVMAVSDRVTVLKKGRRVETVNTVDVSVKSLAQMMVGREVIFALTKNDLPISEPVLEIRDLHALNDMGLMALNGINLTLHKNEVFGLAGVSGNGQRELFEVLVGVRQVESGNIMIDGIESAHLSPNKIMTMGVGYIPDDRLRVGVVPDFGVSENLILGLQRNPRFNNGIFLDGEKIKANALASIDQFGISTPSPFHRTKSLSGGNIQKLILAREMGGLNLKILLANQPTRGLDVGVTEYVYEKILEIREEGVGVLLASEDLEQLIKLSDRIGVIFNGEILGVVQASEANLMDIGLLMAGIKP